MIRITINDTAIVVDILKDDGTSTTIATYLLTGFTYTFTTTQFLIQALGDNTGANTVMTTVAVLPLSTPIFGTSINYPNA
jgi:hypothetical protein